MYQDINECFEYDRNENSVSLQVAMRLSCALRNLKCFKILPFHNILPEHIKRKGHPYQTDFLVKALRQHKEKEVSEPRASTSESLSDEEIESHMGKSDHITAVKEGDKVVMLIEVKKLVATNFLLIDIHDTIELLVYCHYTLNVHGQKSIAGVITDGYNWHCLCLGMAEGRDDLEILKYTSFASSNEKEIFSLIPSLLSHVSK